MGVVLKLMLSMFLDAVDLVIGQVFGLGVVQDWIWLVAAMVLWPIGVGTIAPLAEAVVSGPGFDNIDGLIPSITICGIVSILLTGGE